MIGGILVKGAFPVPVLGAIAQSYRKEARGFLGFSGTIELQSQVFDETLGPRCTP